VFSHIPPTSSHTEGSGSSERLLLFAAAKGAHTSTPTVPGVAAGRLADAKNSAASVKPLPSSSLTSKGLNTSSCPDTETRVLLSRSRGDSLRERERGAERERGEEEEEEEEEVRT